MDACTACIAKRARHHERQAADETVRLGSQLISLGRAKNWTWLPAPIARLSERHFSPRDRQICTCVMIHTITTAMMSVAITQFMTIIAHIVANTRSTDDQRRWMRRALDPGASARVAAAEPFICRGDTWAKRSRALHRLKL
jgi:hypothetical protein